MPAFVRISAHQVPVGAYFYFWGSPLSLTWVKLTESLCCLKNSEGACRQALLLFPEEPEVSGVQQLLAAGDEYRFAVSAWSQIRTLEYLVRSRTAARNRKPWDEQRIFVLREEK